jgi:hypothetical protein
MVLSFLTSALDEVAWSASRPARFTPREISTGILWIGGWVDPSTGMDSVEKRESLALSGN